MSAPGERRTRRSCPCLHSDEAPLCRADLKALHVPPRAYLEDVCSRPRHRKCPLYRAWLQTLSVAPDGRSADAAPDGTTLAATNGHGGGDEEQARREELMLAVLKKLLDDERGQDVAEYGIGLTVIGVCVALVPAIVTNVNALWTAAAGIIAAAG